MTDMQYVVDFVEMKRFDSECRPSNSQQRNFAGKMQASSDLIMNP